MRAQAACPCPCRCRSRSRSNHEPGTQFPVRLQNRYMQKPVPRYIDTPWEVQSHCFFMEQYTMPPEANRSPGQLDSVPLLYLLC